MNEWAVNAPMGQQWGMGQGPFNTQAPGAWDRVSSFISSPQFPIIAGTLGAALSGTDEYGRPTPMAQIGTAAAQLGKGKLMGKTAENASAPQAPSQLAGMARIDPNQNKKLTMKDAEGNTYTVEQYEDKPWVQGSSPGQTPQTQAQPQTPITQGQPTQAQQLAQQMGGQQSQVPFQEALLGRRLYS